MLDDCLCLCLCLCPAPVEEKSSLPRTTRLLDTSEYRAFVDELFGEKCREAYMSTEDMLLCWLFPQRTPDCLRYYAGAPSTKLHQVVNKAQCREIDAAIHLFLTRIAPAAKKKGTLVEVRHAVSHICQLHGYPSFWKTVMAPIKLAVHSASGAVHMKVIRPSTAARSLGEALVNHRLRHIDRVIHKGEDITEKLGDRLWYADIIHVYLKGSTKRKK